MDITKFLAAWGILAYLSPGSGIAQEKAPRPPNIVFILTDDQAYDAMGAAKVWEIETPNMDQLARRGVTFTHTYNMGAWDGAVCVSSRTMLNLGRSVWRAHQVQSELLAEMSAGRLWSSQLAEAGYETYFAGKWHLVRPARRVFDHVGETTPGMVSTVPAAYYRPADDGMNAWSPFDKTLGGYWRNETHLTEITADDGIALLRKAAAQPKPFFLYLGFNAPHDPRQSPERWVAKYPLDRVVVPANFLPEYPHGDAIGSGRSLRDEQLAPWPRTEAAIKLHRAEYFASISFLDEQMGRVIDELDKLGCTENTVVIFTSDHGLSMGSHGLLGKQNLYEHSLRVPLIMAGPGFPADTRISARVYLQDVMPTTLEIAGKAVPSFVEFKSLLPLVRGEVGHLHDYIYAAYMNSQRALIHGRFKLIEYPSIPLSLLYDLEKDPLEMNNLADSFRGGFTVRRLKRMLRQVEMELEDPVGASRR